MAHRVDFVVQDIYHHVIFHADDLTQSEGRRFFETWKLESGQMAHLVTSHHHLTLTDKGHAALAG